MDVNGGQYPNPNGSPIYPGTLLTGPLLAGSVFHSDGSGTLAGLGETQLGTANVGYCVMAQSQPITQASGTTTIVIPAQSQILRITMMVTTAWTGTSATFGVGNTVSATAYTAAGAANGGTLGPITLSPGTSSTAIANWDNVGNTDVQILVTSTNTGSGVGTLTVEYIQGINQAS
jgi:hypothetical protein